MSDEKEHVTVKVNRSCMTVITCPSCKKSKNVSAARFRKRDKTIELRCDCNYEYILHFDFPKTPKSTSECSVAKFKNMSKATRWDRMSIKNLTTHSIDFSTRSSQKITKGDRLLVDYIDFNRSSIQRRAIVKLVRGKNIRCFFLE